MKIDIANHDCTLIWDGIYYFALSDYPHISSWELKKLLAFMDYEKRHGRKTEIECEDTNILKAVNDAIAQPEMVETAVLPSKITECTACKQHGCLTEFVCHTATLENAKKILASGKLLSAIKAFAKTADELIPDKRNAAGDPADFFEYIMFGWGNCQAGDRLVMERNLNGSLNYEAFVEALETNLTPGVRFYFRYKDIIRHPGYVFDGYHPAKIKDELTLSDCLYACIIPEQYKNEIESIISPVIIEKIYYLPQDGLGIWDWSERVYDFVKGLGEVNGESNLDLR